MIVAEGDARRHAAEVLLQGDARVAKRRLREVKDGALGKQLLHIRVAGAQQPSLEVGDTRLRYKGGGRRDLLLVANHQHARAAQQRQDGSYVGLRRLVDNDQVERADGRRQALGDAPRGHDPAGDGGGAVGERRGEVGPVARGARRVGTHASRVGNGRDEAHQPSACLGRHGGAERLLGGCGDERAHGRLALKQTPLRRTSRRARRARVAHLGLAQGGSHSRRSPQPARIGWACVERDGPARRVAGGQRGSGRALHRRRWRRGWRVGLQ
mmetsp:Transcript_21893/g.60919  ORF Transcript_21893/g.60919 Transcript_21893/m.60919 type:complete len:269 (-) Transcript_21893:1086-1892(-)